MPAWRWAVVLVNLNPTVGSEQAGQRPALVVSNEDSNQILSNVTILPLSSTRRNLYPAEVLLPAGIAGQPQDSVVMAHQIRTISKSRIVKTFGYLTNLDLQVAVHDSIVEHLDL